MYLPDPGIEPGSPALQVDFLPTELRRKPLKLESPRGNLRSSLFLHNSLVKSWAFQGGITRVVGWWLVLAVGWQAGVQSGASVLVYSQLLRWFGFCCDSY